MALFGGACAAALLGEAPATNITAFAENRARAEELVAKDLELHRSTSDGESGNPSFQVTPSFDVRETTRDTAKIISSAVTA